MSYLDRLKALQSERERARQRGAESPNNPGASSFGTFGPSGDRPSQEHQSGLASLYAVLRDTGEAGYRIRVSRAGLRLVGDSPIRATLLARLQTVKRDLLVMLQAGEWKQGDDVLTWPDAVFQDYARQVADRGRCALVDPETYERFRVHNVVDRAVLDA